MRKAAGLFVAALLTAQSARPMVLPIPYATEYTQLAVFAKTAMQVIQGAQMIKQQIEMLKHEGLAGQLMTAFQWGQLGSSIYQLSKNIQQGQGLAYTMSHLDTVFRAAYPGYLRAGIAFGPQYVSWGRGSLDTISGALNSIGVMGSQLPNDVMIKNILDQHAQSAVGQNQILQASAEIASDNVSELMKLRQLMLTQTTLIAQGQGAQVNKDLVGQQVLTNAMGPGQFSATN